MIILFLKALGITILLNLWSYLIGKIFVRNKEALSKRLLVIYLMIIVSGPFTWIQFVIELAKKINERNKQNLS